jgi:hypothetical protein
LDGREDVRVAALVGVLLLRYVRRREVSGYVGVHR